MPLKIAFGGKMGTGKDCAVHYLSKKYNGVHLSFAKPLYDILYYAQKQCKFPKTKDRKFLQFIGTEWAKNINSNVWINLLIQNTPENTNVFVSDLRFPDELEALKNNGWICIKLLRTHNNFREGTGDGNHCSETLIETIPDNKWDFIINNNNNITNFYEQLDKIITIING